MGIADRHYIRDQPPPSGRARAVGAVRMFSANTWIILICVAVFVIDGMLPQTLVTTGKIQLLPGVTAVPDSAEIGDISQYRERVGQPGSGLVPLYDRPGGTQIGLAEALRMHPMEAWLHFSTERGFLNVQFWRLIGFQFLHSHFNVMHLLFNMLALFFFGPLIERHLGSKRYVAFYLLCGIFGALMYALLNLGGIVATLVFGEEVRVPGLLFNSPATPLIGASAGVFGVLMAAAYLVPHARVLFLFVIPMKMRTLVYALVALALWTVIFQGRNAGGEAGHLGGALAGFYFIRHQHHLHGFFDFLGRIDPTSRSYRGPRRAGSGRGGRAGVDRSRKEVDRILDKISTHGLHSLTEDEKRTLREASR